MNFEIKSLSVASAALLKADGLIVLLSDSYKSSKDELLSVVDHALKAGDFETKAGKSLSLYRAAGFSASRVVFAGVGEGSTKDVRQAMASAMGHFKGTKAKQLVVCFADTPTDQALKSVVTGAAEASYVYTTTKSKPEGRELQRVLVGVPKLGKLKSVLDSQAATVAGVEFAKEWANRPANYATPTLLADAARSLVKFPKIKCQVLGPKEVEKLKMGAFMAVAQGSEQPLQFIVLRYEGAAKSQAPTVLVGKGITFDCGGVSIKPAAEMDEMKYDMCGAASVLGVFRALGELSPAINVIGLIPACENLVNGRAVKPGDVVTSMSGQTIEILNTDAEGRLVLCDALTYAERFKPRAVIDIATLTGACVVALGAVRSGLFSNDEGLVAGLSEAGANSSDPCWRMPLDDEYAEGLKTNFADVANVAGRAGGAVTAAKFLQRFTAKFPWAHLDIAGTAWKSGAAKGATGRPVPLLMAYLTGTGK
ncbi:leucyl aminopeptidase [Rhodoferax sp. PAMC 29310]|uniref:leucyl aminopeptidase n=1 Tax=Rhodoferax sp. PAMC 29310 TaxID=2822760 RepID=UPI001B31A4B9|nr:leucyl aminopeptidase [Rhodoferax sp. PAMC 29310]